MHLVGNGAPGAKLVDRGAFRRQGALPVGAFHRKTPACAGAPGGTLSLPREGRFLSRHLSAAGLPRDGNASRPQRPGSN